MLKYCLISIMVLFAVSLFSFFSETQATVEPTTSSLHVAGYKPCGYYQRAKRISSSIAHAYPSVTQVLHEFDTRDQYHAFRASQIKSLGPQAANHNTSPLVWLSNASDESHFVGGSSDLVSFAQDKYPQAQFKL